MTNINAVLANVRVDDLEAAIPLYQQLSGAEDVSRFPHEDLQQAIVGQFLLVSGAVDNHPVQVATLLVASMDRAVEALESHGAELLEGPQPGTAGVRLVARHPDGSVFEYVELP